MPLGWFYYGNQRCVDNGDIVVPVDTGRTAYGRVTAVGIVVVWVTA